MSDLERVLSEAQQARQEAEAATRRAGELESRADAAQERARQEREARHRAWAQGIVDSYEADLTTADAAIQTAHERFLTVAVKEPASAVTAYVAWADAANHHYIVQARLASVAPLVGIEATPPEHAEVPPFSHALDDALARHVAIRSDGARDKAAAEIEAMLDTDD